jgi:release factor glutamine methyltransferase
VTSPAGRTVGDLLEEATRRLAEAHVPEPRREATALLALALAADRGGVAVRRPDPIPEGIEARIGELLLARERRVPLQHLVGRTEFHGLDFEVGPEVLIPRPETEDLVDAVLGAGLPASARVADLGTGSGCIAIALAVARPGWRVVAVDRSAAALAVAARNAAAHGVGERVRFVERDFSVVADGEAGAFDAVASNPPYVPEDEWRGLQPEVRDHEPRLALVPGPTGHEAYAVVARSARRLLRPAGLLAVELGWTSEAAVRRIVGDEGFVGVAVRPDLQGIPRVLTARSA